MGRQLNFQMRFPWKPVLKSISGSNNLPWRFDFDSDPDLDLDKWYRVYGIKSEMKVEKAFALNLTPLFTDQPMARDNIYGTPQKPVAPFQFDRQVAGVFDDMIRRSVPFYDEIIRRQLQLIARFYQVGSCIYDLGCSTGNLCIRVCRMLQGKAPAIVAVDNSEAMIEMVRQRLGAEPESCGIQLLCEDIRRTRIERASVVALNFTLQFVPVADRDALIFKIFNGLQPGGILLLCEKVIHDEPALAELQTELYYSFKRKNGYSELEISQKREALEKVLVPETVQNHEVRLTQAGFAGIDIWLKWFNFAAFIAVKPSF